MRLIRSILALTAALVLTVHPGCKDEYRKPVSLSVFCGAANKPAMEEIAALFEAERGIEVLLTFGGSGTLLSQIELSKSGEVYLAGSPHYIRAAERKKLIFPGSDRKVAYLIPAIVTPAGNPAGIRSLEDLTRPGLKIGFSNPKTVCLGLYGVELFETNGLLDPILKNVVTLSASCSKTANLAAMSQVDAVFGWRVFQFWNPDRMTFVPIAPERIPRISYIAVSIPVYTRDRKLSEEFVEFVLSDKCRAIYEKYGYITDPEEARTFAPNARIGGEYHLPDDFYTHLKTLWENN